MSYDLETERIIAEIRDSNAKTVGLQFPEGLKDKAVEVAGQIEDSTDAKAIILTDPTYGACDMKEDQAALLGLDLLVHFGHTSMKR